MSILLSILVFRLMMKVYLVVIAIYPFLIYLKYKSLHLIHLFICINSLFTQKTYKTINSKLVCWSTFSKLSLDFGMLLWVNRFYLPWHWLHILVNYKIFLLYLFPDLSDLLMYWKMFFCCKVLFKHLSFLYLLLNKF